MSIIRVILAIAPLALLFAGVAQHSAASVTVVSAVCPQYPPIAIAAQAGGDIQVKVSINESGKVTAADPLTGHPLLKEAAKLAAMNWQFDSGHRKETAILSFTFRLMPRCSPKQELTSIFYPPLNVEVRAEKPPIICEDCPPSRQKQLRCTNP